MHLFAIVLERNGVRKAAVRENTRSPLAQVLSASHPPSRHTTARSDTTIEVIMKSISSAGFKPGEDISICLDVAANELNKPKNEPNGFVIGMQVVNSFL